MRIRWSKGEGRQRGRTEDRRKARSGIAQEERRTHGNGREIPNGGLMA
jgi:hypothetical protein